MSEKKIKKYTGIAKKLKIVGIILVALGIVVIAGDIYKAINSEFVKGQLVAGIIVIISGVLLLVLFNNYKHKINGKTIWELISIKLTSNAMKTLSLLSIGVFFLGIFILSGMGLVGDNLPWWGYLYMIITILLFLFFWIGSEGVAKIENKKKNDNKSNSETVTNITKHEHKEFNLGHFNFEDADRQKIKTVAIRYMPTELGNVEAQLEILKSLSAVMDIGVTELKTEFSWKIHEGMPDEIKKERFKSALVETILSVNQSLCFLNPEFLMRKVKEASCKELLKAWIVLDYYANVLKPEHTINIQHFRDYIHDALLKKENNEISLQPIKCEETSIFFDSKVFLEWKKSHPLTVQYEFKGSISLAEKEPIISFYEDGVKTVEYCLQTEGEEDFTGKYFLISVRVGFTGNPLVPTMQMDGFISDTSEDRKMTSDDIGYRMEGHYLSFNELSNHRNTAKCGKDLIEKGLRYPGYTTPGNIRMVGICQNCKKSIAFKAYNIYFNGDEPVYSDDGLSVCYISGYEMAAQKFDKENWFYEKNGKTYRYYNSFCCPHCGEPYIDYKNYKEMKISGICACVFLDDSTERVELQSN